MYAQRVWASSALSVRRFWNTRIRKNGNQLTPTGIYWCLPWCNKRPCTYRCRRNSHFRFSPVCMNFPDSLTGQSMTALLMLTPPDGEWRCKVKHFFWKLFHRELIFLLLCANMNIVWPILLHGRTGRRCLPKCAAKVSNKKETVLVQVGSSMACLGKWC